MYFQLLCANYISMKSYTFQASLKSIWQDALAKYKSGQREPKDYFDDETLEELASVGLYTMDIYDYVEDYHNHGEPDLETFLMICEARRDYFLNEQKGRHSAEKIDNEELPAKEEELQGIVWLPRIIPKALGKLRGELPPETMYCCGGDRKFLKKHDIHPAEFLRAVWAYQDDTERLVDWVKTRQLGELTS